MASQRESGTFRQTGAPELRKEQGVGNVETLVTKEQLRRLLIPEVSLKPFSELSAVTYDHQGSQLAGHLLLDTLEEAGFGIDDFDAVGALTAAAIPLAISMVQAAASRGQDLDAFVMDFVYPGIKGPSVRGERVFLLDAWLSEKSYVQTSSLVTLRNGNELSLDFGILQREGAEVLGIVSLIGAARSTEGIEAVNPLDGSRHTLPFVRVFDEDEFSAVIPEHESGAGDSAPAAVDSDAEEGQ
ncbi:MAG: orotate phosphoribosyltransferase [Bifidobacterium crudilactis]|nr:orotate phosphoribosyltransferase [Bifidobacterium crudilactis]